MTTVKKYIAFSLMMVFSLAVGVPVALAHSGHDHSGGNYGGGGYDGGYNQGYDRFGPRPHSRCILVNGRWFAMSDKWFKRVHYNWDRIEARGITLEEIPCRY